MSKQEKAVSFLAQFLPPGSFDLVAPFFQTNTIYLSITYERKSVLGDYRPPSKDHPYHRISINSNLNPYSFLITLLHELAHLFTYNQFGVKASPHGAEWKEQFRRILTPFTGRHLFPPDVEKAIHAYLSNPAASTCTDPRLYKALYRYDEHGPNDKLVDDVPTNAIFETEDGTRYQKLEKVRTRTKCKNLSNGKMYFFPGIYEVKVVDTA